MPKYKTQTNDLTEVIEAGDGGRKLYMHNVGIYQGTLGFVVYTYDPTPKTKVKDYMKYMFNDTTISRYPAYFKQAPLNNDNNMYIAPFLQGRTGNDPYFHVRYGIAKWNNTTNTYDKITYRDTDVLENQVLDEVIVIEVQ